MATAIALAKAKEEGNCKGKCNVDSDGDGISHKDGMLDGDCEGDST